MADPLHRALTLGVNALSHPITVPEIGLDHAIVGVFPVFSLTASEYSLSPIYNLSLPQNATTLAKRMENCRGFIVSGWNFADLVNQQNELSPIHNIITRIYDATDGENSLKALYEPAGSELQPGKKDSFQYNRTLDFGDPSMKYQIRCSYSQWYSFPFQALGWSLAALVIVLLSALTLTIIGSRVEAMRRSFRRMEHLKNLMTQAKLQAEAASSAKGESFEGF